MHACMPPPPSRTWKLQHLDETSCSVKLIQETCAVNTTRILKLAIVAQIHVYTHQLVGQMASRMDVEIWKLHFVHTCPRFVIK